MNSVIDVATGEVKAAKAPAVLQCLALGSCVAVILYDKAHKIGGIAHVMLPSSIDNTKEEDLLKHADHAIHELVRQMQKLGADDSELTARIVGGALVVSDTADIGKENIEAVRKVLQELNIKITGEHLGGTAGRSVLFNVATGELQINGRIFPADTSEEPFSKEENKERELGEKAVGRTKKLDERVKELEDVRKATVNLLEDLGKERERLAVAKAKDEAILASIGDGLVVVDHEMQIVLINRAAEISIGWKSSEVLGKLWQEVIALSTEDGNKVPIDKSPLFLAIHAGKTTTTTTTTYYYVRKDKTRFPVAITITPIVLNGEIIGAVDVFRDITKEKEVDRAKTEFVSLASHQLRTPLSTVNWYTEMLLSGDAGQINENQKKYLQETYKASKRMVGLVNALLNVSRLEMGTFVVEPKPVEVVKVAKACVEELNPQISEKKLDFREKYDQNIPIIPADPKLLTIIFQNLLSNAVKYTPVKGEINLLIDKKNNDILITVVDTGLGIPKHQQVKIFTKLFRADNTREVDPDGAGLGLYIVKAILDHCRGKIWFESEENKGTTFYVSLPLSGMAQKEGTKQLT